MALARWRRFATKIGIDEPGPQICVLEQMGDTVGLLWMFEVVSELVVVVVQWDANGERLKLCSERIE